MPFAVKFPWMNSCHRNTGMKTGKIVTFEYVVWKGINDDMAHIRALVDYCKKVPSKVNLIEYNAIGEEDFQQAAPAVIDRYIENTRKVAHITATVRRSPEGKISMQPVGNCYQKSRKILRESVSLSNESGRADKGTDLCRDGDVRREVFTAHVFCSVSLLNRITHFIVNRKKALQMRPMFVFLTAKMLNKGVSSNAPIGNFAVELIHTVSLVHDDVVDDSNMRRGFFSVNALWKNKIAALGW